MVMINVLLSLSAPGRGNMVVIQSPRSSEAMDACLSEALVPGHNIALAAEYGMFVKVQTSERAFLCFFRFSPNLFLNSWGDAMSLPMRMRILLSI